MPKLNSRVKKGVFCEASKIMKIILLISLLLSSVTTLADNDVTVIKHIASLDQNDPQNSFYVNILDLACKASIEKFGPCKLKPISLPMYQERQLKSLSSEMLDITWTATTPERESKAKAIKFPLMHGLLGYRVAVLNKKVINFFNPDSSLAEFQKLRLVQGHDWPDTKILQNNMFSVVETSRYRSLYSDTAKGVYDFVLRGILEVESELIKYPYPDILLDNNHLIVYPLNIYFFVANNNQALAERLEYGLRRLDQKSNYLKLLVNYAPHKSAIKSLMLHKRKVHLIDQDGHLSLAAINSKIAEIEQLIDK